MASITIRNIDDSLKHRLRVRAAEHGHSMEEEARAIFKGDSNKTFRSMLESMDEIIKINDAGSMRSDQTASDVFNSARAWIIGLLAAIVVIAFGLALAVARAVSRPLNEAVSVAERVAQGDQRLRV